MRKLDRMIQTAKVLLANAAKVIFSDNEDGFLDALGVDPQRYAREQPDGTIGYDFMKALDDTARADWSAEEELLEKSPVKVTLPKKRQRCHNLFGWG